MKRSVQAFEMKTLISALLDFTEPNFQGLPLCGPGKGKKAKINGKNSLDVMLRPELQPFPVCTPRGFIRFAKSDTRRPLHPCLRSNQDQFRLEVPPGSLSPQPCPACWLSARELPAVPFATALTPHHSRVEAQPRKCLGISSGAALDLWRPEARGELPEGADPPGALQRALRGRTLLPAEVIGSFFLHCFGHSQTSLLPFFSHTVRLPITWYRPLLQGPTPASSVPSQRQASRESRGRFPGVF